MPKLRRLSGKEVLGILQMFGFEVIRVTGSHYRLRRTVEETDQYLSVPLHGNKPLPVGTLKSIYRQASEYLSENDLREHFYT